MRLLIIILFTLLIVSCRKFVAVDPPATSLTTASVFQTEAAVTSALSGIYSEMARTGFASGGDNSVTLLAGLAADELELYDQDPQLSEFYTNNLLPNNGKLTAGLWSSMYTTIYAANAILEGLSRSSLPEAFMQAAGAEATFIRAFSHLYLCMFFDRVPYIETTDYQLTSFAPQQSREVVLAKVIADLSLAEQHLPEGYAHAGGEKVRVNRAAARALLARCYLYAGQWQQASDYAELLINDNHFQLSDVPELVFLKNSSEAIWQLRPVLSNYNTFEGHIFIVEEAPLMVTLSQHIFDYFEEQDERKQQWTDSITTNGNTHLFAHKYKVRLSSEVTEYSMVLRLAEQYLIRAEARTQLGDYAGASADLNVIRTRAGIDPLNINDKNLLLNAILNERKHELFTEWGHRFIDLIRTDRAAQHLSLKNFGWVTTDAVFPIPQVQLMNAKHFAQNPGY